ncbi:hypothetical protein LfeInf_124 [Lactobacillus phage LfeInf]|uniref:Uncharacterized protein n=1 Tax=Lactobacillus phage LfeInf TaxID=1567484 RepID=A0A0A7NTY2_9CAUD|nr:hypothetical protein AXJ15_gp001 [Lactobacillus phage LfeInf]YP_009222362.1 hypothetical protein AXJ15_gp038 [Lactobacillus phage LfeInf]AIZ94627.1 hypothetical protein LfeInf_001 [Lactobacillus phage LfeInf]AIZ94750.1 hypothetical protein LfeInf_124 [Lactobacillus phage LfeInf]
MKNYNEMTSKEKAQLILENTPSEQLQQLAIDLSQAYGDYGIQTTDDWFDTIVEEFNSGVVETDIVEIIRIAQQSKDLDICDTFIRGSIYYYDYKTSDNALDLVNDEELSEWIENAIEDDNPIIEDANNELEIEAMQEGLKND